MDIITKMENNESHFSKAELKVYRYLKNHLFKVETETITKIATLSHSSTSAVLRFCQTLGYKGYKDFRYDVITYLRETISDRSIDDMDLIISQYETVISQLKTMDRSILNQLVLDLKSNKSIFIYGIYASAIPARFLHLGLQNQNILSHLASDLNMGSHLSNVISDEDILIMFSISGSSYNFKHCLGALSQNMPKASYLISLNEKAESQQYFSHIISLPGRSFSKSSVIDLQSISTIFVEILLNQLHSKK